MNTDAIGSPVTVSVGLIGLLLTLPLMEAPFTMALERGLDTLRRPWSRASLERGCDASRAVSK